MVTPTGLRSGIVTIPTGKEQKLNPEDKNMQLACSIKFKLFSGLTALVGLALLGKSIERSESKVTLVISLLALPVILVSRELWAAAGSEALAEMRREEAVVAIGKLEELKAKTAIFFEKMLESEYTAMKLLDNAFILRNWDNIPEEEKNTASFKYFEEFIQDLKVWSNDLPELCTILKERIQRLPDDLAKFCKDKKLSPEYIKRIIAREFQSITECIKIKPNGDYCGYPGSDSLGSIN